MAILKTAAINEPRIGYNPADGTLRGLLIEEQRTNKCQNYNLNPDAGLTNISASAGTLDRVNDAANIPFDGETVGGNVFHLNNATGSPVTITVTGTTGNVNAHSIRVFARFTGTAPTLQLTGAVGAVACNNNYAETRSDNITPALATDQWQLVVPDGTEVWFLGNQLEEGNFATSPIETAGAAVTRAADNVSSAIVGTLPDEWSVVFDGLTAVVVVGSNHQTLFSIGDGTNANRVEVTRLNSKIIAIASLVNSTITINKTITSNYPDLTPIKISVAVVGSGVKVSVNGGPVNTIAGVVASAAFTQFNIGRTQSTTQYWGGWIKNLTEYQRALSDAELIAESTL